MEIRRKFTINELYEIALALLWVWLFAKNMRLMSKIVDQRNKAQAEALKYREKYKYLVAAIFELKSNYALQCGVEETQERALMQHAAICELLFRAGLAGTGDKRDDDEN